MRAPRRTKRITAAEAKAQLDAALAAEFAAFEKSFAPRLEAALEEAATNGAAAERARIASVYAQKLPGHEELIGYLAFETEASGPEAAVHVIAAERLKRAVDADLRDAADAFREATWPEDLAKMAQAFVDQQFVIGVIIAVDDVIDLLANADARRHRTFAE